MQGCFVTTARRNQVHIDTTPYYHCIARCVRRAFLCGDDVFSGKNYDHRKQWIVDKLKELAGIFAIDVCAYAIMSNHYHVVLHVDKEKAKTWTQEEVIDRWYQLFNGTMLVDRLLLGEKLSKAEHQAIAKDVRKWRERLMDISWFMRCLNESIARNANEEDRCKGRFWEGRFKSQALLDEAALLTCMMYVDLNPIRAGVSKTPETSDYTSIQERLMAVAKKAKNNNANKSTNPRQHKLNASASAAELLPFIDNQRQKPINPGIPFPLKDYIELIDWTGRAVRDDKKGAIPGHIAPILQRLQLNEREWLNNVTYFGNRFYKVVGKIDAIRDFSRQLKQSWLQGLSQCSKLYRMQT
jgi:REP element-mobilizing transposase RayT